MSSSLSGQGREARLAASSRYPVIPSLSERDRLASQLYFRCAHRASRVLRRSASALLKVVHRMNRLSGEFLFVPMAGDLYIASYPRSGTTWLQMILYQLTTDGKMDFEHISDVIPFFERSLARGQNLNVARPYRIFKTHLRYRQLPRGPFKYIYVVRDGRDVLTSYFHFHRSHLGYKGSFDSFFELFIRGKVGYGSWFQHVGEWKEHARDENVLFLRYEDLESNLLSWLPRIAQFCGARVPADKYESIRDHCSFAFMRQHEDKFDFMNEVLRERGFKPGAFLRQGKTASWSGEFTRSQTERFQAVADSWSRGRAPKLPKLSRGERLGSEDAGARVSATGPEDVLGDL